MLRKTAWPDLERANTPQPPDTAAPVLDTPQKENLGATSRTCWTAWTECAAQPELFMSPSKADLSEFEWKGTITYHEWKGLIPNEGLECGCLPSAWWPLFVAGCRLVLWAPFALPGMKWCFKGMYYKWLAALCLWRLCWYGIEPWAANMCLAYGLHRLADYNRRELSHFKVPSDKIKKKHIRVKNPYLSSIFGSPFYMGEGDYDHWFPKWQRSFGTWMFKKINEFYKPNVSEPHPRWGTSMELQSVQRRCTRDQWQNMVRRTMGLFDGDDYLARVDLSDNRHTAEAAIRFCIQGYGSALLEKDQDGLGYAVDLSAFEALPMRKNYHRLGGKLRLSANLDEVLSLDLLGKRYTPGHPGWKGALYVFRSSCGVIQVVYPHLVHCHYLNGGLTATAVREMPPNHPWRRILSPFTVETLQVNFGAKSLISQAGSILDRLAGWTLWTTQELHRWGAVKWRCERFPEELKRRGVENLSKEQYPYGYWGKKLFKIIEDFCQEYVDHYWKNDQGVIDDLELQEFFKQHASLFPEICKHKPQGHEETREALVTFLSNHIWIVTAVHEHSGHVADLSYQFDMFHTFVHFGEGSSLDSLDSLMPATQARLSLLFARALTSAPGARLYQKDPKQLSRFFLPDCNPDIAVKFMTSLKALHDEIDKTDHSKAKRWEFRTFDPNELEISVTV